MNNALKILQQLLITSLIVFMLLTVIDDIKNEDVKLTFSTDECLEAPTLGKDGPFYFVKQIRKVKCPKYVPTYVSSTTPYWTTTPNN